MTVKSFHWSFRIRLEFGSLYKPTPFDYAIQSVQSDWLIGSDTGKNSSHAMHSFIALLWKNSSFL